METINEVIAELLGSYKASFYITYFIFVMLGILVSLRVQALSRDKNSPSTPFKFSWAFLLQDNLIQLLGSVAFVFLSIRVGAELTGKVPTYWAAVVLGFGFDYALGAVSKFIQSGARKK